MYSSSKTFEQSPFRQEERIVEGRKKVTPLHNAAKRGGGEIVDILLNVTIQDKHKINPLEENS